MTREEFTKENQDELDKPVTLGVLLESYSEFLIPAMSDMMDEKIKSFRVDFKEEIKLENAKLEHNLKSYIDRRLSDHTVDIFKRLETDKDLKQRLLKF